jgi:hypothetical protein
VRQGKLTVWLGGLLVLCQALGLSDWGAVEVAHPEVIDSGWQQLKERATLLITFQLQEQSRYAAKHKLTTQERRFFRLPTAAEIVERGRTTSEKPEKGQCPYLLHVGPSKAFVSKSFVPFGASQHGIANKNSSSVRTVRRHQSSQKVKRRQLVQAKAAYTPIRLGLEWEATHYHAEPRIVYFNGRLTEPNGISSSTYTSDVTSQNFFKYGGKTWRYRCNLYGLDYTDYNLTSMKFRRHSLKSLMRRNRSAGGDKPSGELMNGLGLEEELSVPSAPSDRDK